MSSEKVPRHAITGKSPEMPTNLANIGEFLINQIGSRDEGINLKRVSNFIKVKNLKKTPHIFTNTSNLELVRYIVAEAGYNYDSEYGQCIPELDLILIQRHYDLEKINGTLYTEAILAHELAHATVENNLYLYENNQEIPHKFRSGFAIKYVNLSAGKNPTGFFLEEGFADMIRAEYIAQNIILYCVHIRKKKNWKLQY